MKFTAPFRRLRPSELSPRSGCQCKVGGIQLESLLADAWDKSGCTQGDSNPQEIEDCAVVGVAGQSILASIDLAPLPFPELFSAGRISTLHAFSDIYARGGTPLFAMAALIVPTSDSHEDASIVLAGAMRACADEGASLVHGQTIYGDELMCGVAVLGTPSMGRLLSKRGCQNGDLLMLSKPLGTGLVIKSFQLGLIPYEDLLETQVLMERSNRDLSRALADLEIHACTDVSGFGFLGHLSEMLNPGQGATISMEKVPLLKVVKDLPPLVAESAWITNNRDYAAHRAKLSGYKHSLLHNVLFDPQTNGGLLVAADPASRSHLVQIGFYDIGVVNATGSIELR